MAEQSHEEAVQRAAELLHNARYVVALTGAGISVESGIPPFRGPGLGRILAQRGLFLPSLPLHRP